MGGSMNDLKHQGIRIAITPGAADPTQCVAIMQFLTIGRGDALPYGATWLDKDAGWWQREPTDENIFACVLKNFRGGGRPVPARWDPIDESQIPADRTYRGALVHAGGKLEHHIAMARAIHKDRLREARAPQLAALDVAYQRADETGDGKAKAEIARQKQALRDVTKDPAIDAAETIDQLKAVTLGLL